MGKQIENSFSTSRPLELLHMNLFRPFRTFSLREKFYAYVIVDNCSRFTWILF